MQVEARIIQVVQEILPKPREVQLESDLISDLEIDSFSKLMLIGGLEDEFGISIDEGDFSEIKLVADIVSKLKENYPEIMEDE